MAVAEVHEFNVGNVIGQAFTILIKNIVPFGLLAILFTAPTQIYALISIDTLVTQDPQLQWDQVVVWVVDILLTYGLMAALVYGTIQQLRNHESSVGEIMARGLALMFPVLGVAIVVGLGAGLASLLLIIPGVILAIMWSVAIPVAVVERPGVFASLGRSAELTKGHRWKIFAIIIIVLVIQVIVGILIGFMAAMGVIGSGGAAWLLIAANWIVSALVAALYAVLSAAIYYELRTAKEGVDIEEIASVFD